MCCWPQQQLPSVQMDAAWMGLRLRLLQLHYKPTVMLMFCI
jgi:hypothetical protein